VKMLGMVERVTWPLRRFAWWVEEKLIWPLTDSLRGGGARANTAEPATVDAKPARTRRPDIRIAVLTGAAAVVIGVGIAALLVSIGGGGGDKTRPASLHRAVGSLPPASAGAAKPKSVAPNTLKGVNPDFKSASQAAPQADAQSQTQPSPLAGTNSKPSSIPPGVANDAPALSTARSFAGAFVLYEVGKTNAEVKKTFARTATPSLAKMLRNRPPRLPGSVKVPQAKVQNVVLGARHGRQVEASVSLLRLGSISELRLTLTEKHGAWAVSEVRG
jgi:hypothetical protein